MKDAQTQARMYAASYAMGRFEIICEERESIPAVGSMSAMDVAAVALEAKEEAEERHGIRITATLDEEGNWHFA